MQYAAYGSNLHPRRLRERITSAQLLGACQLVDWSLRFHKRSRDGSGKCNIVNSGEGIYVAIYEISAEDKLTLDKIEGLGSGYDEGILNVPGFDDCVTYLASDTYIDDTLAPYDWYREMVLVGCRALKFPESYIATIEGIQVLRDPNVKRRADRWSTVKMIQTGTARY